MKKGKSSKKILIVEDDEDFISILKIKLIAEGFSIVTAKNGEDGISVSETEKPDLIVSDILMPIMNGVDMAKKIIASNKNAKILFLTNTQDADYATSLEAEPFGSSGFEYLIKANLRINEIVDKIKLKLGV